MKNRLKFLNFSVNFPKKMIYTKKALANLYLKTP